MNDPIPAAAAASSVVYPSIFRRLAAMVYESFLVAALFIPTLGVMLWVGALLGAETHRFQSWAGILFALLPLGVWGVYFIRCWRAGHTLAMKAWKLRIADENGSKLDLRHAAVRYLCALSIFGAGAIGLLMLRQHAAAWSTWLLFAPACVSLLWVFIDRDKQFLYDRIAGTRLILLKPARELAPLNPPHHP